MEEITILSLTAQRKSMKNCQEEKRVISHMDKAERIRFSAILEDMDNSIITITTTHLSTAQWLRTQ